MQKNIARSAFALISMALLALAAYRAAHTSFVYDESITYLDFVHHTVPEIFRYPYLSANNHVLNTLLMKLMLVFAPPSDFVLRLPNVMAFALYLGFAWLLFAGVRPWLRLSLFIIITCNPFILDYFSMARGYGLGMGFMMGSLYFFKRYAESRARNWWLFLCLSLLFANLALLSNFTLTSYYIFLNGFMLAWLLHRRVRHGWPWKNVWTGTAICLVWALPLALYVIPKINQLMQAHELYFGGSDTFWNDTVARFFHLVVYYKPLPSWLDIVFAALAIGVPLATAVVMTREFWQRKFIQMERNFVLYSVFGILGAASILSMIQHYFFKLPYLTERTALYLLVLYGVMLVLLLEYLASLKKIFVWIAVLFAVASLANTISSAHPGGFLIFQDQTREAIQDIEADYRLHGSTGNKMVTTIWIFAPSARFYQETHHDTWLKVVVYDDFKEDYVIWGADDMKNQKFSDYDVLKTYPIARMVLLKHKPRM